ncbi:DUF3240 domain-containing protein [Pseudoalteromonas sp. KS88]|uniref:DUF3240 family protein n=1 Tax=Pseudoalteromonas sp. KS88 TaxID=2109918 RepID=UPI0010817495|nr:DUF3240 family protein [Pseudoalteromonas sp. KS88]TGE79715.1 DUF3240 domain-containing protein [Pseudoalteromonas sp. KS88]
MSEQVIFTLNVPSLLKDDVIDILIDLDYISGFNLNKIQGFSKEHSQFDTAEQVAGHRTFYQFEVLILSTHYIPIKEALKTICQPARLKYWLTPVIDCGKF